MIRWGVTLLLACLALSAAAAALVDAELLKRAADGLAGDGRAERFPLERLQGIQHRVLPAALALGLAAVLYGLPSTSPHRPLAAHLRALGAACARGPGALRGFVRREPLHAALLLALTLLGAAFAVAALSQPMRADEASTFLKYVARPLPLVLSVYDTNNHVLHSLLAKLSVSLFGEAPWAIRLPAFAAGVALLPLGYAALRVQVGRAAALLSTAVLATSSFWIDYASSARGYTLMTAAFLGLLALAPRLLAPDARAERAAAVLLAAVGFFTVPVMAYPAAIVGVWLLLGLARDVRAAERLRVLRSLALAGLALVLAGLAFYAPIMIVTDPMAVVSNEAIARASDQSRLDLLLRSDDLARGLFYSWGFGEPLAVKWGLLAGFAASPLLFRRIGPHGGRLLLASLVAMPAVLLTTGAQPPPWIFLFAFPLYVGLGVASLLALLRLALGSEERTGRIAVAAALAMAVTGAWIQLRSAPWSDVGWYVGYRDGAAAADFLAGALERDDRIDAHSIVRPPVLYYLYRSGFSDEPYSLTRRPGPRAGAVYLIDSGHFLERRLGELRALGFDRSEPAATLPESRILRLTRSEP